MALNDPDGPIAPEDRSLISSIMTFLRCSAIKQVLIRYNQKILIQLGVYDLLFIGYYNH